MNERIIKKREVMKLLNISKYRYAQFIEQKILPAPVRLTPNGHPVHFQSHVDAALAELENREEQARRRVFVPETGGKPIRPFSEKQKAQIRAHHAGK